MKNVFLCCAFLLTLLSCSKNDDPENLTPSKSLESILLDKKSYQDIKGKHKLVFNLRYWYDAEFGNLANKYAMGVLTLDEYRKALEIRKNTPDKEKDITLRDGDFEVSTEIWNKYNVGDIVVTSDVVRNMNPPGLVITMPNPPQGY